MALRKRRKRRGRPRPHLVRRLGRDGLRDDSHRHPRQVRRRLARLPPHLTPHAR